MASGVGGSRERRAAARQRPEAGGWHAAAVLRPGLPVQILDLATGGARVASTRRMKPGARAELHLGGVRHLVVHGRIDRCQVTRLSPLLFEGVVIFDKPMTG